MWVLVQALLGLLVLWQLQVQQQQGLAVAAQPAELQQPMRQRWHRSTKGWLLCCWAWLH